MKIPEGTVLSHIKRKAVSQRIQAVKNAAIAEQELSKAITPFESAARTMQQRGERYLERMAGISEDVLPHLESLPPEEILNRARDVDYFDRVTRRTFGLNESQASMNCPVNIAVLTNQAAIVTPLPDSHCDTAYSVGMERTSS